MLFRQGKWEKIIRKFKNPESPAVRSAVLFAYYKSGQLDRAGLMNNLVIPQEQQNYSPTVFNTNDIHFVVNFGSLSSAFMVSDMAYHLYWTNIAQRTAFEAMEYIPNYNKSARALKILTEISIITEQYDLARKYISIMDETTFYRGWAKKMRALVDHPKLIEQYPSLQKSRESYKKTEDAFFI